MPSNFLSHSSADKPFTRRLAYRLSKAGVRVWIDEAELKVGDSLLHKLSTAISDVDYVGAVISKSSALSRWVIKELQLAMARELTDSQKVVLPILIEDTVLPSFLADKIYADFRDPDNFNESFYKLLIAIGVESGHVLHSLDKVFSQPTENVDIPCLAIFPRRSFRRMSYIPRYGVSRSSALNSFYEREPFDHYNRRVLVYWHTNGISKEDALHITGHLSSFGVLANVLEHHDPRTPDAFFVSRKAQAKLIALVLQCLPVSPTFIFSFDYESRESGALSDYTMSVGLHHDFHEPTEAINMKARPIPSKVVQELTKESISESEAKAIFSQYCE